MALKTTNPTKTKSWKKLQDHYKEIKDVHMKTMFSNHPERAELLSLEWEDFYLDYSKHRIDQNTIQLLTELAKEVDLSDAIEKYFSGGNSKSGEIMSGVDQSTIKNEYDTYI